MTITLSDGTVLTGKQNGNNLVSQTELTSADFAGKLSKVKIVWDDGGEETLTDAVLTGITKESDGWYVGLYQPTGQDAVNRAVENEITDVQEAIAEVYEIIIGG